MPATPPRVTVLGSMNMDISVTVPELPGPGATVLGSGARFAPGGKGGNQAVAAARLGAEVRMAGCVGHDEFGGQLLRALGAESVDTSAVREVQGVASGLALITVDSSGENMITVAAGANESVGDEEVSSALAQPPDVLVISAEVPVPAIEAALDRARTTGPGGRARTTGPDGRDRPGGRQDRPGRQGRQGRPLISLLNLAPVPPGARDLLAAGVGWLIVNETEASAVLGHPVAGLAEAATAATALLAVGATHAVVTAGAAGAAYAGPGDPASVPGFPVQAIDTVGAGDTFVGALATALGAGAAPADAVRAACAAAAVATTRPGTQGAMPHPADVPALTGVAWPPEPRR
jgi:ribokinase